MSALRMRGSQELSNAKSIDQRALNVSGTVSCVQSTGMGWDGSSIRDGARPHRWLLRFSRCYESFARSIPRADSSRGGSGGRLKNETQCAHKVLNGETELHVASTSRRVWRAVYFMIHGHCLVLTACLAYHLCIVRYCHTSARHRWTLVISS